MTDFRIDYASREIIKVGYVDGVDTGTPDDFRTFEPTGDRRFYLDDVEVERARFMAVLAVEAAAQGIDVPWGQGTDDD